MMNGPMLDFELRQRAILVLPSVIDRPECATYLLVYYRDLLRRLEQSLNPTNPPVDHSELREALSYSIEEMEM